MKKLTSVICCLCLMIAGASLVVYKYLDTSTPMNTITAQPVLHWAPNVTGMPLDLQLDLEKSTNRVTPIKDSINIIDSVRIIEKVRWKTRYKTDANRTLARMVGEHPAAVTPDSLPENPAIISTVVREEQTTDTIGPPKVSIILTVDGEEVYKR